MDLLIHVGLHKTGTTTVQDCLYKSQNKLIEAGILYPDTGLFGSQHALFPGCLIPRHFYLDRVDRSLDLSYYIQQLSEEVLAHDPSLVVLSSEVFSEIISLRAPCVDLVRMLGCGFRSTHLLVTVRSPQYLALSALKHSVRDRINSWICNPVGSYIRAVQSVGLVQSFWKSLDLPYTIKNLEEADSGLTQHYFGDIFSDYSATEHPFMAANINDHDQLDERALNADILPPSTYMMLFLLGNTHGANSLARRRIFSEIAKATDSSDNYRELRATIKSEHLIKYFEYFKAGLGQGLALDLASISSDDKRKALEMTGLSSQSITTITALVAELAHPRA